MRHSFSGFHLGLSLLGISLVLGSCSMVEKKRNSGAIVAEYDGQTITRAEINQLTMGMNSEDSARIADAYIRQWAMDLVEYNKAKDVSNKQIERLVEDYRHSLYTHEYEEHLIAQRMPKHVEDSVIQQFYDTHISHFVLRESILHGVLLVVPNGAPNMNKLRKWLQTPETEESIENIEKYAYQYATGYELFLNEWKTAGQIQLRTPITKDDFSKLLKQKKQIELQDSLYTYLLEVTDSHLMGETMPLDYATPEIQKIILNQRQVEFIQHEREALYEQAVREHKVKRY